MSDEPVKILVVDDRPENLLALEGILEPLGQKLVRANSGPEALRCVLESEFATILLDVQMPGMNGFEVAEIIKSRERSRTIPIIFLSAISKEDAYVFKGYAMGAVDYVFKPFNPDVLRMKVAVFVDLFVKQRELQRQAELLREAEKRELELEHRTSLLEAEARSAAKLSQMNEELHRRQIALEQAMGARNRFYASMSHELRTPINAVIGYSTLMLDNIYGPLNAKQKEGLQRMVKAVRHLLELVNGVLVLSKIVTCKQNDERGVELEVIDEGVGIAAEDIARIFEEFVQVSESKQPGTGLGLPISRRLAQLLDGSLTVFSTPGQGSTFRLTLPPSLEDDLTAEPALSAATAG